MDTNKIVRDMLEHKTFEIEDGYATVRKTKPIRKLTVRAMTRDEILALGSGDHVWFIATTGRLRQMKVNGQVRRWKRDPERVEIPCKYGMYEYHTFSLQEALERFVVRLEV